MPKRVVKYTEIAGSAVDSVETIGGGRHYFNPEEVRKIGEKLPAEVLENLHLPFVFVKSIDFEESVYLIRVYGSEAEAFRILMDITMLPRSDKGHYTYKPLVAEFINRYPSLAIIGYF